ncbi:MAG TPA: heavy metal sensor histidine kinase [Bryobacteraceae bacterium]|nr:heavy metal sensor histidine kinase [Bryobacteraceae bacterium]
MTLKFRSPERLRTRIALSYILLIVAAMLVFTAGTAIVLFFQMRAQVEHYAIEDIETVEGLISFTPDGRLAVRDDYHNHPESKRVLDYLLEVRSPEGGVLYRNARLGNRSLGAKPSPEEGVGGYSPHAARLADGTRVIMASRRHSVNGKPTLIRLAQSEEPVWHALREFLLAAALIFPLMAAAAAIVGRRMSRRILTPVQMIADQARRITSSSLHERIPVNGAGDELDDLARIFNQTLTRLEKSFQQLRQFTSDVSHELRTPLAAIRSIGEVGLDRDGTREHYREFVGSMLEEVNRLTTLVNELLMISRADSGAIRLHLRELNPGDLVRETVSLLEPLAEEKGQTISIDDGARVMLTADPVLLRQALMNILHNAIKYSPPASTIAVSVAAEDAGTISVSVRDSGPGIAPEHAERIFDRFYRVDQGRSRDAGGFGLGLSIAQWAVQAHHGQIRVESKRGEGSTFRITIPAGPSNGAPRADQAD